MTVSDIDVTAICQRFNRGEGETVPALAAAYGLTAAQVRYYLKKEGQLSAPSTIEAAKAPFETDEELGIGVDDDAPDPNATLAALMANPALAALIDQAVAARVAQLGVSQSAMPQGSEAFAAFTQTLKHLIDTQAMQQPGYIKPLPADEIDRRAAGKVEMFALLRDYERRGEAPLWEIGEGGFFECTNAMEFPEGAEIRTFLPPPEDFIPKNEPAERVHAAMMQWLGGPTPDIGEQVEAAHKAAHAPLISSAPIAAGNTGPVQIVTMPGASKAPPRPKRRGMGTIVTEPREIGPGAPGSAPGPRGPSFDNASV